MFYETAQQYKNSFQGFHSFPPITDRASWSLLDAIWRKKAVETGEQYIDYQYPYLSATDFMDFVSTGNRVRYETKYFSKRHALNALVLAECTEYKGRFIKDIINGIFALCDESAWQLPPHNSYIRDTPQLPMPDVTAPILDIFACETGAILGMVYYLLRSVLDEISPFIAKRILYELQYRIFDPYVSSEFWWMGNDCELTNNWTIWCTQNVLLAVFSTNDDDSLKRTILVKASKSIDYFLRDYGEDGCCDEGAQYYRHAGLCLFNVIEICNEVASNVFLPFYQNEKIKNIAAYILHVHINDKYYVNFSDCSPVAGRAGVREFLFAKRTGNEAMARFAACDYKADLLDTLFLSSENNLYYRLQNALHIADILAYDTTVPVSHSDIYYPSVGLFCVRDTHLYLSVKAGDNADNHNHNDTGSFIIYKDGKPMFIDIGVESYTKQTFSPERYELWTMQSAYHNLPTVNGHLQKAGEEYRAQKVNWLISGSLCSIEMNLEDAYPKECRLQSYHRQATLMKEDKIIIKDHFSFLRASNSSDNIEQVIINLITYEKPAIQYSLEDTVLTIGTLGILKIKGGTLQQIEELPVHDPRLMLAWEHELYRITILVTGYEIEMAIS